MKRSTPIGVAVLAVLALGALVAATAFALPEVSKKGKWSGKNTAGTMPTLETASGTKLTCNEASASGEDTSASLGTYTVNAKTCESPTLKVKCNSLGDLSGTILIGGEYHLVWDSLTTLGVAVLFLIKELHVECTSLVLVLIKDKTANGGMVCLITEPGSSKATHVGKCEATKGVQSEKTYWNDSGTELKEVELSCSANGGAAESCAVIGEGEVTYAEAVSTLNV